MYYRGEGNSKEIGQLFKMSDSYVRGLLFRKKGSAQQALEQQTTEAETPVSPVSTPVAKEVVLTKTPRFKTWEMDAIIYTTTATTCVAFATVAGWWALPLSVVYALVLLNAMRLASDQTVPKTAANAAGIVILFEVLAACAHTYIFNLVLWGKYKSMPFGIHQEIIQGEVGWVNGWIPFAIAATIGAVLSGSAVCAVIMKIQLTSERARGAAQKPATI